MHRFNVGGSLAVIEAGIPENWIVNPLNETVIVFRLKGKRHLRHGLFRRGHKATSARFSRVVPSMRQHSSTRIVEHRSTLFSIFSGPVDHRSVVYLQ